jgi:hypothetical protein
MDAYLAWINEHYPTKQSAHLKCREACEAMAAAFPELKKVRGHFSSMFGDRPHWWMVTESGEVIDPTMHQFDEVNAPFVPALDFLYDAIDEETFEEPLGKCMNCGELCYASKGGTANWCSDECFKELSKDNNE